MDKIYEILNYNLIKSGNFHLTVKALVGVILAIILVNFILNLIRKIATRKLSADDKLKFVSFFEFIKYFIYVGVVIFTLNESGVKVTGIIAGAAALMVGVGLALQTFFQDIISGVFILLDQTVHVGDIIEIEGKVGKVTHISLRTTKALTIENKVLVIPNHKYLTNTLYNWTQNSEITRETVIVGVAYGSDVQLVKKLLLQAAKEEPTVLLKPAPMVLFDDFGDSALVFKLIVTLDDSFNTVRTLSNLRFKIDQLFRESSVTIPFPQRDVHIIQK